MFKGRWRWRGLTRYLGLGSSIAGSGKSEVLTSTKKEKRSEKPRIWKELQIMPSKIPKCRKKITLFSTFLESFYRPCGQAYTELTFLAGKFAATYECIVNAHDQVSARGKLSHA